MVGSMAAFALEDMLIKSAASTVPIGLILAIFGVGGTLIFILLTWRSGDAIFHPFILSPPVLVRASCEVVGRLTFALAITLTSLSSASAILQATPLVVVFAAAFIFGEHVCPKRWVAIICGFVGVLLIIRPGFDSFEPASLFAMIATLGFAGRDLATRATSPLLTNMQLGIYGFFILIPTGLIMWWYSKVPVQLNLAASAQILGAIIFGVIAYYALTVAMRIGEVSVVSPFRYTRLLFAILLGMLVFGETLDMITVIGSLIIMLSGGYILLQRRGKQIKVIIS
ncbi:DMT family transporter [Shewanella sp. YLB-07]|nr:DMT family transporter [Shewanella sp. YLB-07]